MTKLIPPAISLLRCVEHNNNQCITHFDIYVSRIIRMLSRIPIYLGCSNYNTNCIGGGGHFFSMHGQTSFVARYQLYIAFVSCFVCAHQDTKRAQTGYFSSLYYYNTSNVNAVDLLTGLQRVPIGSVSLYYHPARQVHWGFALEIHVIHLLNLTRSGINI